MTITRVSVYSLKAFAQLQVHNKVLASLIMKEKNVVMVFFQVSFKVIVIGHHATQRHMFVL